MPSLTSSTQNASVTKLRPNASASLEDEFALLAIDHNWVPRTKKYRTEQQKFLVSEYNRHLGYVEVANKLDGWQKLCLEVGIETPPPSITQCKKVTLQMNL